MEEEMTKRHIKSLEIYNEIYSRIIKMDDLLNDAIGILQQEDGEIADFDRDFIAEKVKYLRASREVIYEKLIAFNDCFCECAGEINLCKELKEVIAS